jgi:hypothetical protein
MVVCIINLFFDTVPHQRLAEKLRAYGISGNLLNWIGDFLSDRKQRVVINGAQSEWADVISGIPQGSVLGPILFVIYINDLPDEVSSTAKLFADDTKLYAPISSEQDCETIQQDLDILNRWSDEWLLRFNSSKCKLMHLGSKNPKHSYYMNQGGQATLITEITEEKDLGVTFDPSLKFSLHVNNIVSRANGVVGAMRRAFDFMDIGIFRKLYKALVRPHLEYSSCVWSPRLKKDIEVIEGVQRRATKLVPEVKDKEYPERLKILDIATLAYRRKRADMIQVFKSLKGLEDFDPSIFFTRSTYLATRGHEFKLYKSDVKHAYRKHFFSQRIIDSWNGLPQEVVEQPTIVKFKIALDDHWKHLPLKFNFKAEY